MSFFPPLKTTGYKIKILSKIVGSNHPDKITDQQKRVINA